MSVSTDIAGAAPPSGRWARPLGLIEAALVPLVAICDFLVILTIVALVADLGVGVLFRYVADNALPWTDEVASYLFVSLTFFGAASSGWRNLHPRIDVVINRVPVEVARLLRSIGFGALISLLAVLTKFGVLSTEQTASISMVSLPLSQGWAYAIIPISSILMFLFAARNYLRLDPAWHDIVALVVTVAILWALGYVALSGMHIYTYLIVVMMVALLIGVPVGFSLALTALLVLNSTGIPLDIVPQRLFDGTSSVILTAIPLFMLTGTLMSAGGLANRLAAFMTSIFGRIRGGLGIADVGASVIFADISGSAVADSAAIGTIMIPQLVKRGYSVEFASALQAAAGSLGLMFPPSSTMIVYAWVAGISVSGLFLHSFLPGLLVAASFSLVIYIYALKRGYPKEPSAGFRNAIQTGSKAFFALLIPVIILVMILGGVTTPSEAGVIAVLYTLVTCLFIYRDLKFNQIYGILLEAALNASRVTLIIASATLLSWVIATFQGPQKISAMILDISHNPIVVLILLNIFMTVLHTMLEGISTILVLVPVILPLMRELHIDPVVFGIILAQNSALGLLFPPLGFNLYVISSISGVAVERVAVAVLPFIFILTLDILVLIFFPQISTVLPWLFGRI